MEMVWYYEKKEREIRMKTIIMRKQKSHRVAIRFFATAVVAVSVTLGLCLDQPIWVMMPVCSPALVLAGLLLGYYETWRIVLDAEGVEKQLFGMRGKKYRYHQIQAVISRYSYTQQETLRILVPEGKSLCFCLEDENGKAAKKHILRHCAIRNPE